MNNLIPIEFYTSFYYQFFLIVILVTLLHVFSLEINHKRNIIFLKSAGVITLIFTIFYMGLRPVDSIFVDMWIYNYDFTRYQEDGLSYMTGRSDILFNYFTYYCSQVMSAKMYFLICATLYVMPLYFVMKKWFENFLHRNVFFLKKKIKLFFKFFKKKLLLFIDRQALC